jgi:hypothetical protein
MFCFAYRIECPCPDQHPCGHAWGPPGDEPDEAQADGTDGAHARTSLSLSLSLSLFKDGANAGGRS